MVRPALAKTTYTGAHPSDFFVMHRSTELVGDYYFSMWDAVIDVSSRQTDGNIPISGRRQSSLPIHGRVANTCADLYTPPSSLTDSFLLCSLLVPQVKGALSQD